MSLPVVPMQVYTRSVIDPLPAPEGEKNADKLRKKGGKMTDEEIMEKLRMSNTNTNTRTHTQTQRLACNTQDPKQTDKTLSETSLIRYHRQYRRSQEKVHALRKDWPGVSENPIKYHTVYIL